MKVEIIPIKNLQLSKTCFYTVKIEGRPCSEFKDFAIRMVSSNSDNKKEFGEISMYLKKLGNEMGAIKECFKREREADRLVLPYHVEVDIEDDKNFGLRLYCYWFSEKLVFLFNGDRKTNIKAELCENVRLHFLQAIALSRALDLAFGLKKLQVDDEGLYYNDDNFNLEI